MADEEKETIGPIIEHVKETNSLLKDIKRGDEVSGKAEALIKAAMPEMLNDTRLQFKGEKYQEKKGITEVDEAVALNTEETVLSKNILTEQFTVLNDNMSRWVQFFTDSRRHYENMKNGLMEIGDGSRKVIHAFRENGVLLIEHLSKNQNALVRVFKGSKELALETLKDSRDFMAKTVASIGRSIKDSFETLSETLKFDGFIASVGKWLIISSLFFLAINKSGTFANMIWNAFGGGRETTGFFDWMGKNFGVVLFGTLALSFNKIKMALFGPKGFFGLFGKYIGNLFSGLGGAIKGGTNAMRGLRLAGSALWQIFKRIIAIPFMLFSSIMGFFKGFQDDITAGGSFWSSIGQGLIGAIKGVLEAIYDILFSPIKWIMDYLDYKPKTYSGPVEMFKDVFKSDNKSINPNEFSRVEGDETKASRLGKIAADNTGGGGGGISLTNAASITTNNQDISVANQYIEDLYNRRYGGATL